MTRSAGTGRAGPRSWADPAAWCRLALEDQRSRAVALRRRQAVVAQVVLCVNAGVFSSVVPSGRAAHGVYPAIVPCLVTVLAGVGTSLRLRDWIAGSTRLLHTIAATLAALGLMITCAAAAGGTAHWALDYLEEVRQYHFGPVEVPLHLTYAARHAQVLPRLTVFCLVTTVVLVLLAVAYERHRRLVAALDNALRAIETAS